MIYFAQHGGLCIIYCVTDVWVVATRHIIVHTYTYMELLDLRSSALASRNYLHTQNVNTARSRTMPSPHIAVLTGKGIFFFKGHFKRYKHSRDEHSQHCVTAPVIVRSRYSRYML